MYEINQVDGVVFADTILRFNSLAPETFPPLEEHHLTDGYWWLAYLYDEPVAFAGMVPFLPGIGYLKRCFVLHRGHGLQYRLMLARCMEAKRIGWTHLVSECHETNTHSAANFLRANFSPFAPDQKWAGEHSLYFIKHL